MRCCTPSPTGFTGRPGRSGRVVLVGIVFTSDISAFHPDPQLGSAGLLPERESGLLRSALFHVRGWSCDAGYPLQYLRRELALGLGANRLSENPRPDNFGIAIRKFDP